MTHTLRAPRIWHIAPNGRYVNSTNHFHGFERHDSWERAFTHITRTIADNPGDQWRPFTARFQAQAWSGDTQLDIDLEGPTQWVVSEHLRGRVLEELHRDPDTPELDFLLEDPAAPEQVRHWPLAFHLEILDATPATQPTRAG